MVIGFFWVLAFEIVREKFQVWEATTGFLIERDSEKKSKRKKEKEKKTALTESFNWIGVCNLKGVPKILYIKYYT